MKKVIKFLFNAVYYIAEIIIVMAFAGAVMKGLDEKDNAGQVDRTENPIEATVGPEYNTLK